MHGDKVVFLAKEVKSGVGFTGFWYDDREHGGRPASVPRRFLPSFKARYGHYYKGYHFQYDSPLRFIAHVSFRFGYCYKIWDSLAQRKFNKRQLVRQDRMEILRYFQEKTLIDRSFECSALSLFTDVFSLRSVSHPHRDSLLNYYEFVLESLTGDGDLKKTRHTYSLTPKAFSTLTKFEEDNTRHQENVRQQTALTWLTIALLVIGVPQAVASAIEAYNAFFNGP